MAAATGSPIRKSLAEPATASRRLKQRGAAATAPGQKGRQPVRDAVNTRQRILTVAASEFASKGYDGARIDDIVRRAKISKNLIYHYFGSKDGLFLALLEDAYARMRERQDALALKHLEPVEAVRKLVIETFTYWREATAFIAYLTSENFHRGRHIRKSASIRAGYPVLIDTIRNILEEGQRASLFRPDVDPVDLYISISALGYHYLANRYTFTEIFGVDLTATDRLEHRLRHIEDVILGYLLHRGS